MITALYDTASAGIYPLGPVVHTTYWPKPIPTSAFDWSAVDDNYDGAPDSATRAQIGYGSTEAEAIADLHQLIEERG